jgi:hypothetical protein
MTATFWWRDDDAVAPRPELDRLLAYARFIPIALAVIPGLAIRELGEKLRLMPSIVVLQHGWKHTDHTGGGRNEYPPSRSKDDVNDELTAGRRLLTDYFGEQLAPVFVPPWNQIDERFLSLVAKAGVAYISRKGPRSNVLAGPGLMQVNAHVSPIRWTKPPSFGSDAEYLAIIEDHLRGRRTGRYDINEPTGLLTHHVAQNDRSYEFIDHLVEVIAQHPAAKWLAGTDIFFDNAVWNDSRLHKS